MTKNKNEQIINSLQADVNYYKSLYYHTKEELLSVKDDLYSANEKIKSQQRELKRLNNTTKLAEKFARTVVDTALQDYQNKIKEQEETIKALREQVDYYVNKLQEIYYNETE